MAIGPNDIKPFNEREVTKIETLIDKQLAAKYTDEPNVSVGFSLSNALDASTSSELERRYKKAGWSGIKLESRYSSDMRGERGESDSYYSVTATLTR